MAAGDILAPSGIAAWPLLDETARRGLDAELQAQGYAPTATIDYSSASPPSYLDTGRADIGPIPFGSNVVPTQALNGKPAVPSGITATLAGTLGPQWPLILGGVALLVVLVIAR